MTKDEKNQNIGPSELIFSWERLSKEQVLIMKYDTYIQRACEHGGERHLFSRI